MSEYSRYILANICAIFHIGRILVQYCTNMAVLLGYVRLSVCHTRESRLNASPLPLSTVLREFGRKLVLGNRLEPKGVTLNDFEPRNGRYFASFRPKRSSNAVTGCNNFVSRIFSNMFDFAKKSFARVVKLFSGELFHFCFRRGYMHNEYVVAAIPWLRAAKKTGCGRKPEVFF